MRWVSQLADLTADIPPQEEPQRPNSFQKAEVGFFGKTRLIESSLAALFIPALRDGAHCLSSVTGAEAAAYFLSVPPGRGCRASIYVLSPKFMVDVWVAGLLAEKKICCCTNPPGIVGLSFPS